MLKGLISKPVSSWLRSRRADLNKKLLVVDRVENWAVLRKVEPHRLNFGVKRGSCIDRYYIEQFLAAHSAEIRGQVGEIESDQYTRKFGGKQVDKVDVIDINPANNRRTMTLDLTRVDEAPAGTFDCIVCTQTLLFIEDYKSAIASLKKMLREEGVLLLTVPGICQRVADGMIAGLGQDYWRFTGLIAKRIFSAEFGSDNVEVHTYGNVLTAVAFLHGLVQEELTKEELEFHDPNYELLIGVRALKRTVR